MHFKPKVDTPLFDITANSLHLYHSPRISWPLSDIQNHSERYDTATSYRKACALAKCAL